MLVAKFSKSTARGEADEWGSLFLTTARKRKAEKEKPAALVSKMADNARHRSRDILLGDCLVEKEKKAGKKESLHWRLRRGNAKRKMETN